MQAGRDLDALVAEKVMGLTVYRDAGELWDGPHTTLRAQPILRYSTSISAAWRLVEAGKASGAWRTPGGHWSSQPGEVLWVNKLEYDEAGEIATDTAPHAICLAALRAVGINPEEAQ